MRTQFIFTILFLHLFTETTIAQSSTVEVLVLGIAQDAGAPQIDCQKDCCKDRWDDPSLRETVSSLAISDGKAFYLIDATPDITEQLAMAREVFQGQPLGAIFLTHAHIGHYTGLMYLGREARGSVNMPIYCMPRMAEFLRTNGPWSQLVELGNIHIVDILKDKVIPLSYDMSIQPLLVPHRDEYSETVGFVVKGEKELLYIPDIDKWSKWDRSIKSLIKEVDYALVDGTFYDGDELPMRSMNEIPHPFVQESINLFEGMDIENRRKVKFIHLNHTNPLLNPEDPANAKVEATGMGVARRGMRFEL